MLRLLERRLRAAESGATPEDAGALAERAYLSRFHFGREFRRVVGEAPGPRGILAFDARPREVGPATSERYAEIALGGGRVLRIPLGADAAWVGQLVTALQAGDRC